MSINTSTKLQSYCIFKENTDHEPYLNLVRPNKFKYALSKFRLSSHNLEIETGRYYGIPRDERLCVCCNMNAIETEFHCLLVCPAYCIYVENTCRPISAVGLLLTSLKH